MTFNIPLGASDKGATAAPAKYLNRHGLITGSTGTGKSVSIIGMVEALSRLGVPTFLTDVKGDLSGLAAASTATTDGGRNGVAWWPEASQVRFFDVYGKQGDPLTARIVDIGAPLMAQALALSDAQSGVLEVAYAVAVDTNQPLNTLADLRALVSYCSENRETIGRDYGLVTPASVAAIGRAILRLERAGGAAFFSDSSTRLAEIINGRTVNILDCVELIREPRLYGAVLLWLLDRLNRELPERGDREKPVFCLFLDEAHLIFSGCSPEVVRAIDQTVRLIRSKGVGVFFASQSPSDIPVSISRQLNLRVQHSLRAVTPRDRIQVKAAADSLPPAKGFRTIDAIERLPTGSALVSFLDGNGQPTPTEIMKMQLPRCRLSPLTEAERREYYRPASPTSRQEPTATTTQQKPADHNAPWLLRMVTAAGITVLSAIALMLAVVAIG